LVRRGTHYYGGITRGIAIPVQYRYYPVLYKISDSRYYAVLPELCTSLISVCRFWISGQYFFKFITMPQRNTTGSILLKSAGFPIQDSVFPTPLWSRTLTTLLDMVSFDPSPLENCYRINCRIDSWYYNPFMHSAIRQGMVLYVSMV
jgi:hypothetical protein